MKTSFKPLAYTLAASIALMSCNNVGEQNPQDSLGDNNSSIKTVCKQSSYVLSYSDLDPACKNEDRKLYKLRDEQDIVFEVDGEYYSNKELDRCSKGIYFNGEYYMDIDEIKNNFFDDHDLIGKTYEEVNRILLEYEEATRDEYDAYKERRKRCFESMNSKARDIAVPCELMYLGKDIWSALLTEEEVAELEKTYDKLLIIPDPGAVDGVFTDGDTEDCTNSL